MIAAERKARALVRRLGVDCEIALDRAAHAVTEKTRQHYLGRAAHMAELAHFHARSGNASNFQLGAKNG